MTFKRAFAGPGPRHPRRSSRMQAVAPMSAKDQRTELVPLVLKLPLPVLPALLGGASGTSVEIAPDKPERPCKFQGCAKYRAGKKDHRRQNAPGRLAKITDGNKEADGDDIVQMRKAQWVQFDLGSNQEISPS